MRCVSYNLIAYSQTTFPKNSLASTEIENCGHVVSCVNGEVIWEILLGKKVDMRQIAGRVKGKEADVGSVSLYCSERIV